MVIREKSWLAVDDRPFLVVSQRRMQTIDIADKDGIYVLDEPKRGLHELVGLCKSVIEVEHHQAVPMPTGVDLGVGAGQDGGRVVFEGTPADLVAERSTLTGRYLAGYVAPG